MARAILYGYYMNSSTLTLVTSMLHKTYREKTAALRFLAHQKHIRNLIIAFRKSCTLHATVCMMYTRVNGPISANINDIMSCMVTGEP